MQISRRALFAISRVNQIDAALDNANDLRRLEFDPLVNAREALAQTGMEAGFGRVIGFVTQETYLFHDTILANLRYAKPDATKPEIKAAIELVFKVEVDSVTVINVAGKAKRVGRTMGRRQDWKKAYVRLAQGHQIDFTTVAE